MKAKEAREALVSYFKNLADDGQTVKDFVDKMSWGQACFHCPDMGLFTMYLEQYEKALVNGQLEVNSADITGKFWTDSKGTAHIIVKAVLYSDSFRRGTVYAEAEAERPEMMSDRIRQAAMNCIRSEGYTLAGNAELRIGDFMECRTLKTAAFADEETQKRHFLAKGKLNSWDRAQTVHMETEDIETAAGEPAA